MVGATGRIGRILVRKLLLRGYTVRALVRDPEGSADRCDSRALVLEPAHTMMISASALLTSVLRPRSRFRSIPSSVTTIRGDVGDFEKVTEAMVGVNKADYCPPHPPRMSCLRLCRTPRDPLLHFQVVVCVRSRSNEQLDMENVERNGLRNLTKALLDANSIRAQACCATCLTQNHDALNLSDSVRHACPHRSERA